MAQKRWTRLWSTEHQLQEQIIAWLELHWHKDAYWFAVPNAGKRSFPVAAHMRAEGLRAGVADLCIMLRGGRVLWLEVKLEGARQTPEQIVFGDICKMLGHRYAVVRSLDDAIELMDTYERLA